MRKALVLIAEAGDSGITTQGLADALEYEKGRAAVAGMFGAFGRRSQNRYGQATQMWDVEYQPTVGEAYDTIVKMRPQFRSVVMEASAA